MLATLVERIHFAYAPSPRPLAAVWSLGSGGAAAVVGWLRRTQCGLSGHEMIRRFDADRISLECIACGERSRGWSLR